jgi:hypothetical protein
MTRSAAGAVTQRQAARRLLLAIMPGGGEACLRRVMVSFCFIVQRCRSLFAALTADGRGSGSSANVPGAAPPALTPTARTVRSCHFIHFCPHVVPRDQSRHHRAWQVPARIIRAAQHPKPPNSPSRPTLLRRLAGVLLCQTSSILRPGFGREPPTACSTC